MNKSDIKGGDTLIPCAITTRARLQKLPTTGKTYDQQLNELMDFWETSKILPFRIGDKFILQGAKKGCSIIKLSGYDQKTLILDAKYMGENLEQHESQLLAEIRSGHAKLIKRGKQ